MVQTHKRLQHYNRHYAKACMMGLYGCRWHRYQQSKDNTSLLDKCFFILLIVDFLFSTFWFYFFMISSSNDAESINWFLSESFGVEFQFCEVIVALTAVVFVYITILMVLGLLHIACRHEVYLHKVHKALLVLVLAGCIAEAFLVDHQYAQGWSLLYLSFQVFGPFLQIGGVVLATLLSYIISSRWVWLYPLGKKLVCLWLFSSVMIVIYLSPLFLESPCISNAPLPQRPSFLAHRGLVQAAPENTLLSFQKALDSMKVVGIESDVTISYDGVPYIMHDSTLQRTTNVKDVFPNRTKDSANDFTIAEIKQLNAGTWYIKKDPFGTVGQMSDEEKNAIKKQSVPTLQEVLDLLKTSNVSFMFDIRFFKPQNHPYRGTHMNQIADTILNSGIEPKRIWWLYSEQEVGGAGNFTAVRHGSPDVSELLATGVCITNMMYDTLHLDTYREYRENNISAIVYLVDTRWLLSYMWCAGITMVSSDYILSLFSLYKPLYYMSGKTYRALWISVDCASALIVIIMFIAFWLRKRGKAFNPETLSLHAAKHRISHVINNKNMKEKLIHAAEGFQDTELGVVGLHSIEPPGVGEATKDSELVDSISRSSSIHSHHTDVSNN